MHSSAHGHRVDDATRPTQPRFGGPRRAADPMLFDSVVLTVLNHRRRIARLLSQIDDLQRRVLDRGVSELEAGTLDEAALLAHFADRLRAGDDALHHVVLELQGR
jgi:hypothetical protein